MYLALYIHFEKKYLIKKVQCLICKIYLSSHKYRFWINENNPLNSRVKLVVLVVKCSAFYMHKRYKECRVYVRFLSRLSAVK